MKLYQEPVLISGTLKERYFHREGAAKVKDWDSGASQFVKHKSCTAGPERSRQSVDAQQLEHVFRSCMLVEGFVYTRRSSLYMIHL